MERGAVKVKSGNILRTTEDYILMNGARADLRNVQSTGMFRTDGVGTFPQLTKCETSRNKERQLAAELT